ncbi:unnamed protein product, partial [Prorocentrum cordatum]
AGLGECTGCLGRGGLILMCHVRLGNARPERAANASLSGYNRNSLWACLTFQTGAYDSVVGVEAEQGGAPRAQPRPSLRLGAADDQSHVAAAGCESRSTLSTIQPRPL